MRGLLILAALVGCGGGAASAPEKPKAPRTSVVTTPIAARLVAASRPCDSGQVAQLFDHDGFNAFVAARVGRQSLELEQFQAIVVTEAIRFCAWFDGATDVTLVGLHEVGGESRPLLRRMSTTGVGYFDLRLSVDGTKILDVYSYNLGVWISEEQAENFMISAAATATDTATINQVNALDKAGKYAEALAQLDTLPDRYKSTATIQGLRVSLAGRISPEAYNDAVAQRQRRIPEFQPSAATAMNQAYLRRDIDEALRQVDVLDASIGGDPFLDALRASFLVERKGPGDLDAAAAKAQHAAEAHPTFLPSQYIRVAVSLARSDWATAIATLQGIETNIGTKLDQEQLAPLRNSSEFFATPDYQAWRAR